MELFPTIADKADSLLATNLASDFDPGAVEEPGGIEVLDETFLDVGTDAGADAIDPAPLRLLLPIGVMPRSTGTNEFRRLTLVVLKGPIADDLRAAEDC